MAEVRLRRTPSAVRARIRKEYEEVEYFTPPGKKQPIKRLTVPEDKESEAALDLLAHGFLDVKNFSVAIGTDEAARLYERELKAPISSGDEVLLDGHLTRALKIHLLDELRDLFVLVGEVAAGNEATTLPSDEDVRRKAEEREEALRENLLNGSSSSSDGTDRPEVESAVAPV